MKPFVRKLFTAGIILLTAAVSAVMLFWKPAEREIIEKEGLLAYRSVDDLVNDNEKHFL